MALDLLAAQYRNIWPFKDKLINLNFKEGKYLIKAPIGSGKSFLFFDGPFFWFYSSKKQRPVLNKRSQEGLVRLIFEIDGMVYLIEKRLSLTKAWNQSVQPRLIILHNFDKTKLVSQEILQSRNYKSKNVPLETFIKVDSLEKEEIAFKTTTEFNKILESILPPMEVFLSTTFLMQDSENIFEMTPSERINVFKNIFGLLGIDEATEKLSEEKREIITRIKVLSDETNWKQKFELIKTQLYQDWQQIKDLIEIDLSLDLLAPGVSKPLEINFQKYYDLLNEKISQYQVLKNQLENIERQIEDLEKKIDSYQRENNYILTQIETIKQKIQQFDENQYNDLLKQKQNLLIQIDQALNSYFSQISSDIINDLIISKDWKRLYDWFQQLINEGIRLKKEIEKIDLNIKNLNLEYTNLQNKLKDLELKPGTIAYDKYLKKKELLKSQFEWEINKLLAQKKILLSNLQDVEKQLSYWYEKEKDLQKVLSHKLEYNCKIINKNCPFIKEIKQEEIKQFEISLSECRQNIKKFLQKKQDIEEQIKDLDMQIKVIENKILNIDQDESIKQQVLEELTQQKKQILQEIEKLSYEKNFSIFMAKKKEFQVQIDKKREMVKNLKYNLFKQIYPKLLDYENQLKNIDKKVNQLDELKRQIDTLKQQLASLQTQIDKNKKFIDELLNQKNILVAQKKQLLKQIDYFDIEKIKKLLSNLQQFEKKYIQWQKLYDDYKQSQLEVEKLKEEKKIVTDLHNIFSKELMLMILEGFLPNLFEIINSNLAKVVDFELRFELKKTKSWKLELEIFVNDEKWERPIKSLSGGQKTVLKLAWILSVASKMKNKMLFLDETINSLDAEAIGKVADMIKDFVEFTNTKLYVVTHSKQIQDMDIWDEIILLDKVV